MGSYREEYESYYQSIMGKRIQIHKDMKEQSILNSDESKGNYSSVRVSDITKYLININLLNSVACVAIAGLLIISKSYEKGQEVYDYFKDVSKVSFYYKDVFKDEASSMMFNVSNNIKNEESKDTVIEKTDTVLKPFDDFQVVKKTLSEILRENSVLPLSGDISLGETQVITEKYVLLSSTSDTKVKSIYKGTVKEIGTDENIGEFIVIDLGDGTDVKYGHVKSIAKKVGDEVSIGDVIAEVDTNKSTTINGVILQVIDQGEYKDPKEYINIK